MLWRENVTPEGSTVTSRQIGALLVLPFVVAAGASIARIYPYGGTRHSAFLIMFALAGVSFLLAKLVKQRITRGIALAILIVAVCAAFGKPHRPYMLREDQSRTQMVRAMGFIHAQIPQSDLIFVDYQTRLLLGYYLCPLQPVPFSAPVGSLEEFRCNGYQVVAAGPDLYIFTAENFVSRWDQLLRSVLVEIWSIGLDHSGGVGSGSGSRSSEQTPRVRRTQPAIVWKGYYDLQAEGWATNPRDSRSAQLSLRVKD